MGAETLRPSNMEVSMTEERVVAGSVGGEETRVVVVHKDTPHEGETVKAGTQVLPRSIADALVDAEQAYEPGGKKRGR